MLSHANHCEFCQHQQRDFKQGSTCGLTQKKPFFNNSCSSILFKSDFPDYIIRTHVLYRQIHAQKTNTIIYALVFGVLGIGSIYLGYQASSYMFKYALFPDHEIHLPILMRIVPFVIMGIGVALIGYGFNAYTIFRRDYDSIAHKKNILDRVLTTYGNNSKIGLEFGDKYHGKQLVNANFTLNGAAITKTLEVDLYRF